MERQYILFHTGLAFCVAALVLPAILVGSCVMIALQPEAWQIVGVFAACISMVWIPFWLDRRLMGKRRKP